ncbi:hypothetical protein [Phenylobacterium sp.]|uniref:hypothetical protein n=1 Tax=Phenylobacterium sp. TaxID=1871053 RepID=UPI0035AEF29C
MIALLIAAQVAVAAEPTARETPNLFHEPAACRSVRRDVMERLLPSAAAGSPADPRALRRLDELPWGNLEYAVVRRIDGCMIPAPAGYRQGHLLPGAAERAPRPGDGPANRR